MRKVQRACRGLLSARWRKELVELRLEATFADFAAALRLIACSDILHPNTSAARRSMGVWRQGKVKGHRRIESSQVGLPPKEGSLLKTEMS